MSWYRGGWTPACALVRLLEAVLLALLGQVPQLGFGEPPQKCFSWFALHTVLAILIAWSFSSCFLLFASLQWSCLVSDMRDMMYFLFSGFCSSHSIPNKWDFLNLSYLLPWGVEDFHVFEDSLPLEESHRPVRTPGVDLTESYLKGGMKLWCVSLYLTALSYARDEASWELKRLRLLWLSHRKFLWCFMSLTRFHFSCWLWCNSLAGVLPWCTQAYCIYISSLLWQYNPLKDPLPPNTFKFRSSETQNPENHKLNFFQSPLSRCYEIFFAKNFSLFWETPLNFSSENFFHQDFFSSSHLSLEIVSLKILLLISKTFTVNFFFLR